MANIQGEWGNSAQWEEIPGCAPSVYIPGMRIVYVWMKMSAYLTGTKRIQMLTSCE